MVVAIKMTILGRFLQTRSHLFNVFDEVFVIITWKVSNVTAKDKLAVIINTRPTK